MTSVNGQEVDGLLIHAPDEFCLFMRMPATLTNIDMAVRYIKKYLAKKEIYISEEKLFSIVTVVRECLVNAVVHGCRLDQGKTIDCELCINNSRLDIKITDSGDGFVCNDYDSCEPSQDSVSGRGLLIMRRLADSVVFNESRNMVTVSFIFN